MKRLVSSLKLCTTVAIALCMGASVQAQVSPPATVYASGLLGPRGLKFGPDGMLYVAEAGTGGTTLTGSFCTQVPDPIGPWAGGPTARISRVDSGGNVTTVASGFPSATSPQPGTVLGVADLAFVGGTLYAVLTGGGCSHGNPTLPNGVVRVDTSTSTWTYVADLSSFVKTHPAAYVEPDDFEPDGTPYSMIAKDGKFYVVEANHGLVLSIGLRGEIEKVSDISFSQGHIVPTSIISIGNNFYVGNLGLFPVSTQSERVMELESVDKMSASGGSDVLAGLNTNVRNSDLLQVTKSRAGFTSILGLALGPDGLLYVLEFSPADGFPTPGIGKVVRINPNGLIETVVTGLTLPTAMTFGPDQALYVSNFGAAPGDAGQILRIDVPLYQ